MEDQSDLFVVKAIVHILDPLVGTPIFSVEEHPEDTEIYGFLEEHLKKILKDSSLKPATFTEELHPVKESIWALQDSPEVFVESSTIIADAFYRVMTSHSDIPGGDLVVCLFQQEDELYLGILKCNYRYAYIHYTEAGAQGQVNSIIKQRTALPAGSQKIDEAAIIHLNTLNIQLLEKAYELNGEKQYYLSQEILRCHSRQSNLQKAKTLKKVTEIFNKKFCNQDLQVADQFGKEILKSIEETGEVDIPKVTEKVFSGQSELHDIYLDHVASAGIVEAQIPIDREAAKKVFSRRKIKTDTGIEINLSLENEESQVEFVNHPDGTITIIIKNVQSITYK